MTIFIRVDSGEAIGSGHVMRCLTLADRLKATQEIIFLSKPHHKNIIETIKNRGFKVIELSKPEFVGSIDEKTWLGTDLMHDARECIEKIKTATKTQKTIIVDHYSLDIKWEKELRPYVDKIIVIDDLANRSHDCDILLDQNFYLDKDTRYNGLVSEKTKLFLGCEYALLRPEFYENGKNYQFREDVKNIFVFFGGIDNAGMTLKTLHILKDYPHIHAHIVASPYCPDWLEISHICSENHHLSLHSNVTNMAKLMASCDIAIGAGGTTQWERACIGIPSLVVSVADNQSKICEDIAQSGYCYYIGYFNSFTIEDYNGMFKSFILNKYLRKSIFNHNKKNNFLDNWTKAIQYEDYKLEIRNAGLEDAENVFYWRNHEVNRIYSNNSIKFSMDSHLKWFKNILSDNNHHLYILSHDNIDVGVVRFDILQDYNLVSIYLVPNMHNKGYGSFILKKAEAYFLKNTQNTNPFYAEILSDNQNSIRLFTELGYRLSKSSYLKNITKPYEKIND